jgi:hypothetical protein
MTFLPSQLSPPSFTCNTGISTQHWLTPCLPPLNHKAITLTLYLSNKKFFQSFSSYSFYDCDLLSMLHISKIYMHLLLWLLAGFSKELISQASIFSQFPSHSTFWPQEISSYLPPAGQHQLNLYPLSVLNKSLQDLASDWIFTQYFIL